MWLYVRLGAYLRSCPASLSLALCGRSSLPSAARRMSFAMFVTLLLGVFSSSLLHRLQSRVLALALSVMLSCICAVFAVQVDGCMPACDLAHSRTHAHSHTSLNYRAWTLLSYPSRIRARRGLPRTKGRSVLQCDRFCCRRQMEKATLFISLDSTRPFPRRELHSTRRHIELGPEIPLVKLGVGAACVCFKLWCPVLPSSAPTTTTLTLSTGTKARRGTRCRQWDDGDAKRHLNLLHLVRGSHARRLLSCLALGMGCRCAFGPDSTCIAFCLRNWPRLIAILCSLCVSLQTRRGGDRA